jgi:hypothetical protein
VEPIEDPMVRRRASAPSDLALDVLDHGIDRIVDLDRVVQPTPSATFGYVALSGGLLEFRRRDGQSVPRASEFDLARAAVHASPLDARRIWSAVTM